MKVLIRAYSIDGGTVTDLPDDSPVPSVGDIIIDPARDDFVHHKGKFPRSSYRVIERAIAGNFVTDLVRVALLVEVCPMPEWLEDDI